MTRALITGITGQDGSYLAELLLARDYEVHGLIRRASTFNTERIDHLYRDPHESEVRLFLHHGDLTDGTSLRRVIHKVRPDEIYHLGAQSHVRVSFDQPEYTADVDAMGTLRLLEAVRDQQDAGGQQIKVYIAGSSEMFGNVPAPQSESSPMRPRSPYGVSKLAAYFYGVNYREAYGLFVANGILFNHESPRRGETFVTRKITRAATRIKLGLQSKLYLGNLDARRDWGFTGDYVEAMVRMVQHEAPDDFVIATGTSHSVGDFARMVFERLQLDPDDHIEHDPRYLRPTEANDLRGDAGKAKEVLGWEPSTSLPDLVAMMVDHDLELARREETLKAAGHEVTPRGPVGD